MKKKNYHNKTAKSMWKCLCLRVWRYSHLKNELSEIFTELSYQFCNTFSFFLNEEKKSFLQFIQRKTKKFSTLSPIIIDWSSTDSSCRTYGKSRENTAGYLYNKKKETYKIILFYVLSTSMRQAMKKVQ